LISFSAVASSAGSGGSVCIPTTVTRTGGIETAKEESGSTTICHEEIQSDSTGYGVEESGARTVAYYPTPEEDVDMAYAIPS
jgi:hypothetical protein